MSRKVISIQRISPRDHTIEEPHLTAKGYLLGDPKFGREKHYAKSAIFVKTLTKVAELVCAFSLRMVGPNKRASLVSPKKLQVIRC